MTEKRQGEIRAVALNCTLKTGDEPSSTDLMLSQIADRLARDGVECRHFRIVNHQILPGVTSDEGDGDEWPQLRREILDADILLLGTPVWLGKQSSVCQRVLERLDAFLSERDTAGRMVSYGRVALVATVGNEDGAHHISAELYQALNDVGFSLAANAVVYWVGEAMGSTDYKDLPEMPEKVRTTIDMAVRNTIHLARLLRREPYPGEG